MVSPDTASALLLSIRVAALATLLNALVGIPLAYVLARRRFRGRGLVDLLTTLPLVLPPTVTGYYLIVLLGRRGWLGGPIYQADRLERRLHLVRGGGGRHGDGAAAARAHGARRRSSRSTATSSGRPTRSAAPS